MFMERTLCRDTLLRLCGNLPGDVGFGDRYLRFSSFQVILFLSLSLGTALLSLMICEMQMMLFMSSTVKIFVGRE